MIRILYNPKINKAVKVISWAAEEKLEKEGYILIARVKGYIDQVILKEEIK